MKHTDTPHVSLEELSAFADGDLESARHRDVEQHLRGCTHCASELAEMTGLRGRLAELADAEPRPDLRLDLPRRREPAGSFFAWMRSRWMVPAAALAGAAVALLVVRGLESERTTPEPRRAAVAASARNALAAVGRAEGVYRRAIANLEVALRHSRSTWTPAVRRTVQRGLAEIDRVLTRCRAALRQNPHDVRAQRLMLAAYQQKVDLLSDLVGRSI